MRSVAVVIVDVVDDVVDDVDVDVDVDVVGRVSAFVVFDVADASFKSDATVAVLLANGRSGAPTAAADFVVDAAGFEFVVVVVDVGNINDCSTGEADERSARAKFDVAAAAAARSSSARSANNDCKDEAIEL